MMPLSSGRTLGIGRRLAVLVRVGRFPSVGRRELLVVPDGAGRVLVRVPGRVALVAVLVEGAGRALGRVVGAGLVELVGRRLGEVFRVAGRLAGLRLVRDGTALGLDCGGRLVEVRVRFEVVGLDAVGRDAWRVGGLDDGRVDGLDAGRDDCLDDGLAWVGLLLDGRLALDRVGVDRLGADRLDVGRLAD